MRILDAYIARYVVGGTLLALAVLLSLTAVVSFVEELDSVGRGRYGIGGAIEFVLLTLPRHAFVLFPLAAVIGALIGLGTLAMSSELAVVRASGVSVGRIVGSVLKGALALMVIAVVVGEFVAPRCERLAESRRAAALDVAQGRGGGFWVRDGRRFVNAIRVGPDDGVEDMYIYEIDPDGALRTVTHAGTARYGDGAWTLESVRRSAVSVDGAYELALWTKVVYPIATGVMMVLAVPLVLGRLGGFGIGSRILSGCLIAVTFHVVNEVSGKMGIVYGLNPVLSAFAPTLLFLAVGVGLLRRVR